jgi:hypothetical protein
MGHVIIGMDPHKRTGDDRGDRWPRGDSGAGPVRHRP